MSSNLFGASDVRTAIQLLWSNDTTVWQKQYYATEAHCSSNNNKNTEKINKRNSEIIFICGFSKRNIRVGGRHPSGIEFPSVT